MAEQAAQAFANLATVLRAGDSEPELVVSTTVLVADMSQFAEVNREFAEFFGVSPPARMTMQVTLPLGLLLSIGCTALLRS
jgi:2-iminobutanoate/2-iminopropanoate deaminase